LKTSPLVIIGLGKLGGAEINYGSDLDIIFVTDAGAGDLPALQRVAVEVMEMLSSRTELGVAFHTDARLRPDGEKGLLVNTLEAFEEYYRHRAQLWEIQSLSRTRPVAGNLDLGREFQELARVLIDFTPANVSAGFAVGAPPKRKTKTAGSRAAGRHAGLAAYSPKWREQIRRMRARIEKERTPAGKDALAIKTGAGGLMDAEFLAQTFCLAHGWQEANTLRALLKARDSRVLGSRDAAQLIENYRQLRRVEAILRRWSFEGETVLPDEEAPFYRVSIRCGFRGPDEFRRALAKYRRAIRAVYNKMLDR
jgi:glutamate-ammonia-ligase adenylyltransferase